MSLLPRIWTCYCLCRTCEEYAPHSSPLAPHPSPLPSSNRPGVPLPPISMTEVAQAAPSEGRPAKKRKVRSCQGLVRGQPGMLGVSQGPVRGQ